jgi:sortase A
MPRRSRVLSRILFLGGVLLLAQGGFSVYPFLFPTSRADVIVPPGSVSNPTAKPGSYVFQLSFPRQKATFDVVEGTTARALRKGPGHLEGSAMPGSLGNAVVAGHRDTHFRVLKDVAVGDEIQIDIAGALHRYRIVEARVVSPKDVRWLRPESDAAVLTLITCYPFYFVGPAPDRFVVRARAVNA